MYFLVYMGIDYLLLHNYSRCSVDITFLDSYMHTHALPLNHRPSAAFLCIPTCNLVTWHENSAHTHTNANEATHKCK